MNISVILKGIGQGASKMASSGLLMAQKHAPELLVGSGIVGYGVTIYSACKATSKARDILDDQDEEELRVSRVAKECEKQGIDYSEEEQEKDIRSIKKTTKWRLVKAYAPVATLGLASTALVLGGFKIINGRLVATAAAYKTLEAGFERYRGNVVDEFGKETDWRMMNSIKADEAEAALKERDERKRLESGDKSAKKKAKRTRRQYDDINNRIFDHRSSTRWQYFWTPDQVWGYLRHVEDELNDMLRIRGHVFLNEAWDKLGMKRTTEGQVVGWIYNRDQPFRRISLGLREMPEEERRRILSVHRNEDIQIWLEPNVDGVIYDMIDDSWFSQLKLRQDARSD